MSKKVVIDFQVKGLDEASKSVESIVEDTKTLKEQFREASKEAQKLAGADIIDQKALDLAIAKTADLKDRMNDVNEQVGVLTAGSKFEKMSNNLGDIGSKIASMDFEGANESATRLLQFSKSITFGDAVKGIKDMGSTFLQLGKALLANPLFLIAAVIAGIVYAIVKVLDKIGVLKVITKALGKVFEWLMIPINAIIDGLKALTDWFGWTSNAAEDSAQKQADALAKTAKAAEDKSEEIVQGYDHEIKMAELAGESTREAELKKAYWILWKSKQQAKADVAALHSAKLAGELDAEEIKALEDKARASVNATKKAGTDIKEIKAGFAKEDKEAREKEAEEEKSEAEDKAKALADDAKKRADQAREARKKALEDIRTVEKEYADSLLTEQELEIQKANEKYDALLALAKKYNQDLTTLTTAKNDAINDINEKFAKEESQKLYEKNKETSEALAELVAVIEELENAHLDKALSDQDREKNAVLDKYFVTIEAAKQNNLDTTVLEEAKQAELAVIDETYRKKQEELDLATEVAKIERHQKNMQLAQDFANAATSLAEGIFAVTNRLGAQDEKSREQRAKRQFNINKALSLSTAVITGIQSVMAAFQNGMKNPIPLLGPATAGVYAGIAGVVAAANVAKIAATKFETKGGSASTGGGGGGGSDPSSSIPSPQLNAGALFSTGGQSTQTIGGDKSKAVATPVVKAIVVEQDITDTQQRMSNIKQQASI